MFRLLILIFLILLKNETQAFNYTASDAYIAVMSHSDKRQQKSQDIITAYLNELSAFYPEDLAVYREGALREILDQALERERKFPKWFVFYHSVPPEVGFIYDVLSMCIYLKNPAAGYRDKLRFYDQSFDGINNVNEFIEFFGGPRKIDNYATNHTNASDKYRHLGPKDYIDLGLSVNVSLFGSDDDYSSSSIYLLKSGNILPGGPGNLFKRMFDKLDMSYDLNLEDLMPIFKKHFTTGRLYQIFINPKIVDDIGYLSEPSGVPLQLTNSNFFGLNNPLSELRSNPNNFNAMVETKGLMLKNVQARIFMRPDIFYNPRFVKIVLFDPYGSYEQRQAYLNELKEAIIQNQTKK